MIFDKYPYSNFHEMNDDWIIQTLREFGHRLDDFVAANSLTYADPLEYNADSQYPARTIVTYDGVAYLSKQPVPAGILPTNDAYWILIFPFEDLIQTELDASIAEIDRYLQVASEQIAAAINTIPTEVDYWMNTHPDVTTTVQDESISWLKLNNILKSILLYGYEETSLLTINDFEQGAIRITDGEDVESAYMCRSGFHEIPAGLTLIRTLPDYRIQVFRYDLDGTFVDRVLDVVRTTWQPFITDENHKYRVSISYEDYSTLTPADLPLLPVPCASYVPRYAQMENENDPMAALERAGSATFVDGLIYQLALPDYWFAAAADPQSYDDADTYLDGIINHAADGKHLLYTTDTHWPENAHISQELQQYVRGKINIDRVLFGGDILNRDNTPYIAYQTMSEYFNKCVSAFGSAYLPAFGNHDLNTANTPDADATRMNIGVVAELFTKHLDGFVHFETSKDYGAVTGNNMLTIMRTIVDNKIESDPTIPATLGMTRDEIVDALLEYNKLHYYVDDDINKTRYVVYNTGAPDNIVISTILGPRNQAEQYLQIDWIHNTLMTTPANYDIVLCAHEATLDPRQTLTSYLNTAYEYDIIGQLCCMKKRAGMNIRIASDAAARINPDWMVNSTSRALDFTDAPDVGKIVLLCGHWHRDYALMAYFFQAATGSGGRYSHNDFKGVLIDSGDTLNESDGEILIVGTTADKNHTTNFVPLTGVDESAIDIVTIGSDQIEFKRIGHSWDRGDGNDPGTHTEPITRTFIIS